LISDRQQLQRVFGTTGVLSNWSQGTSRETRSRTPGHPCATHSLAAKSASENASSKTTKRKCRALTLIYNRGLFAARNCGYSVVGLIAATSDGTLLVDSLGLGGTMADRVINQQSTYSDKLFALIPGEVTAAFLAIHSIADPSGSSDNLLILASAIILLAINIPYLIKFQNVSDYSQVAFTSGAFVLWAASIENRRVLDLGVPPKVIAVALILYTLCIPFFVRPKAP
jgi:hypothetical protein